MHADYARQYRGLWERHWWWRARAAFLLEWIGRLHARSAGVDWRILDVGCGDGLFFEELSRFGHVEGLEPDESLVTDPRWRDRIHVGRLGADDVPYPRSAFDLVLMLDVLEHIEDDRSALCSARALLKPGGALVLTVPALSWLWSRHDERNEHYRRYDRRSLRSALEDSGLRVEDPRYFFAWTVAPMLARRWLQPAGSRQRALDAPIAIPPAPINRILTEASRAEHALGRHVRLPVGSSLLAVAWAD